MTTILVNLLLSLYSSSRAFAPVARTLLYLGCTLLNLLYLIVPCHLLLCPFNASWSLSIWISVNCCLYSFYVSPLYCMSLPFKSLAFFIVCNPWQPSFLSQYFVIPYSPFVSFCIKYRATYLSQYLVLKCYTSLFHFLC